MTCSMGSREPNLRSRKLQVDHGTQERHSEAPPLSRRADELVLEARPCSRKMRIELSGRGSLRRFFRGSELIASAARSAPVFGGHRVFPGTRRRRSQRTVLETMSRSSRFRTPSSRARIAQTAARALHVEALVGKQEPIRELAVLDEVLERELDSSMPARAVLVSPSPSVASVSM